MLELTELLDEAGALEEASMEEELMLLDDEEMIGVELDNVTTDEATLDAAELGVGEGELLFLEPPQAARVELIINKIKYLYGLIDLSVYIYDFDLLFKREYFSGRTGIY